MEKNNNPKSFSFWIKLIIAVLSAILGIIAEDKLSIMSNLSNIF